MRGGVGATGRWAGRTGQLASAQNGALRVRVCVFFLGICVFCDGIVSSRLGTRLVRIVGLASEVTAPPFLRYLICFYFSI